MKFSAVSLSDLDIAVNNFACALDKNLAYKNIACGGIGPKIAVPVNCFKTGNNSDGIIWMYFRMLSEAHVTAPKPIVTLLINRSCIMG